MVIDSSTYVIQDASCSIEKRSAFLMLSRKRPPGSKERPLKDLELLYFRKAAVTSHLYSNSTRTAKHRYNLGRDRIESCPGEKGLMVGGG